MSDFPNKVPIVCRLQSKTAAPTETKQRNISNDTDAAEHDL